MLKLLISEMDALSQYVSTEWYHVMRALVEEHGWVNLDRYALWKEPGTLEEKLRRRLGGLPDVLLLWEGPDFAAAFGEELRKLGCYLAYFAEDLHKKGARRAQTRAACDLCDVVLAAYSHVFPTFFPGVARRKPIVWIPHSASPLFRLPFNEAAENAIFLSGAINAAYPLREQMQALAEEPAYRIVHQPHPGYHVGYDYARDSRVGKGYARTINRYRVGFTDALIYQYLVAKYFEIPATGALLLAERPAHDGLRELGFIEGEHYLAVTSETMEETIRYLLDEAHHPALDAIRKKGQALVWARHKTTDRARRIDAVCIANA